MVNPQTVNVGIIVPLTGADVDLWGSLDVNPNMAAIDGLFGGVQIITVAAAPITLTAPAGFVPTPSGGPTQAQNRVLKFNGAMTANILVTLPLPGAYIIHNFTTGNFVLQLRAAFAGEVVAIPPGECVEVYCDGTNVRFINLARVGAMEMWAGLSALPAWAGSCTILPYLICNGAVLNVSDYPALGAQLLGKFGGNGITTFATPDLRGRVPLAYDGTGARITVAGCGINGQTIGAAIDQQTVTLAANQIPSLTSVNAAQAISVTADGTGRHVPSSSAATVGVPASATTSSFAGVSAPSGWGDTTSFSGANSISVAYTNAAQLAVNNVQPSIVTGIWVIKT